MSDNEKMIEEAVRFLIERFAARRGAGFTDDDGRSVAHVSIPVRAALGAIDDAGRPLPLSRVSGGADDLGVMLRDGGEMVELSVHRVGCSAIDGEWFEQITNAIDDVSTLHHGAHGLMSTVEVSPARLEAVLGPWIAAEIEAQAQMAATGVRR